MNAENAQNTSRIARNTLFLYGRMLAGMLVALYTSRLIINALGVEDYGIYGVVGGLVSMLSMVSSSLASSIGRFITFELGRGDMNRLKAVFITSVLIQVGISLIVLLVGETVGLWFMNTQMVIPADRLVGANWVFQSAIIGFVVSLMSCPFHACIIAHERMDIYAYFGIADIVVKLCVALFIAYAPFGFDRLEVYPILGLSLSVIMQCVYFFYCRRHFAESHARLAIHKDCWKDMVGFAGWNTIGCTAGILKDQGVNILLNLFFGPVVNAARGIGSQVSGAIGAFTSNFMTALSPQIIKSHAAADRDYTFFLVERGSRFCFYITMVLIVPVIFATPQLLDLWLGHYPEYTVPFVRLALCVALIDVLSHTLITLQSATGRIRNYQLVVGGLLMLNFPLSYLTLKIGLSPTSVYVVAMCVGVFCLAARLVFLRQMAGLPVMAYVRNVLLNVAATLAASLCLPLAWTSIMPLSGLGSAAAMCVASIVWSLACVLGVGCSRGEREFIYGKLRHVRKRFKLA